MEWEGNIPTESESNYKEVLDTKKTAYNLQKHQVLRTRTGRLKPHEVLIVADRATTRHTHSDFPIWRVTELMGQQLW